MSEYTITFARSARKEIERFSANVVGSKAYRIG